MADAQNVGNIRFNKKGLISPFFTSFIKVFVLLCFLPDDFDCFKIVPLPYFLHVAVFICNLRKLKLSALLFSDSHIWHSLCHAQLWKVCSNQCF